MTYLSLVALMHVSCHAEPLEYAWEHSQFMLVWDQDLKPPTFRFYLLDEGLQHERLRAYRRRAAAGSGSQAGSSSAASLGRATSASGSGSVQMQPPVATQSPASSQPGRQIRPQAARSQRQAASATSGSATGFPPGLGPVGMPPGLPQPAETVGAWQDLLPDKTFGDLHGKPIAAQFQGHRHPSRHLVAIAAQAALAKCRRGDCLLEPEKAVETVLSNNVSGVEKVRQHTLLLLPPRLF